MKRNSIKLIDALSIVSAIITILVFIVSDLLPNIPFLNQEITMTMALAFFIVLSAVLITISVMYKIKPKNKNQLLSRDEAPPLKDQVKLATHDIFLSGICLGTLHSFNQALIKRAESGIEVRIVVLNMNDKELFKRYKTVRGDGARGLELNHLKCLIGIKNIEIKTIDFIPPSMFVGIDINDENSSIQVTSLLYQNTAEKSPHIQLKREDKFFDIYRDQIEKIWKVAKPLEIKTHETTI